MRDEDKFAASPLYRYKDSIKTLSISLCYVISSVSIFTCFFLFIFDSDCQPWLRRASSCGEAHVLCHSALTPTQPFKRRLKARRDQADYQKCGLESATLEGKGYRGGEMGEIEEGGMDG